MLTRWHQQLHPAVSSFLELFEFMRRSHATIAEVAFPYEGSVIYRGHRKPVDALFSDKTSVEIRHADVGDFTLAVRLEDSRPSPYGEVFPTAKILYGMDGALWCPGQDETGAMVAIGDFLASVATAGREATLCHGNPFDLNRNFFRITDPGFGPPVPVWFGYNGTNRPTISIDAADIREIRSSHREQRAADAQRAADVLRIVDGQIWFRCFDPYWGGMGYGKSAQLIFGSETEYSETFRADRLEEMVAWRRRWGDQYPAHEMKTLVAENIKGKIEVMDPSYFSRDDLCFMLPRACDLANSSFELLRTAEGGVVERWVAFRDAAVVAAASRSRSDALATMDQLGLLRQAMVDSQALIQGELADKTRRQLVAMDVILERAQRFEGWTPPGAALAARDASALADLANMSVIPGGGL